MAILVAEGYGVIGDRGYGNIRSRGGMGILVAEGYGDTGGRDGDRWKEGGEGW